MKPEIERLRDFVAELMRDGPWEGMGFDGGEIQDRALKHGLIVEVPFDPAEHGNRFEFLPEDPIYVLAWSKHASAT